MLGEAMASGRCDLVLTSLRAGPEPWFSLGAFYWDQGDNAFSVSDGRGRVSSRGWNESGYANATYDNVYRQLLEASDPGSVKTLTRQAGEILYDDCAAVPLGCSVRYQAWSAVWSGFRADRLTGLVFTSTSLPQQMRGLAAGGK